MKKHLLILLSIAILVFTACKKKETNQQSDGNNQIWGNSFSLKHNGIFYSTNSPSVSANATWIGVNAGAVGETGNYYQLGVKRNLLPGTYEYTGSIDDAVLFLVISDQLVYAENHGSITVLSNDTILKKMEFNFEFEMLEDNSHSDTIQVTEGHGKISY
jgi:hypothetical protein